MSRRKQTKPARHLDDETDSLHTATTEVTNAVVPEEENRENGNTHVCGKCSSEFVDANDFMQHKKACLGNKRPFESEDEALEDQDEESRPPPLKMMVNGDIMNHHADVTDDVMQTEVNRTTPEFDENPESVPISQASEKSDDFSEMADEEKDIPLENPLDNTLDNDLDDEEDDLLDDDIMDEELEKAGVGVYPGSMVYMPTTDSNVKLEKLESTKVAVAQFAENNLPNLPQMDLPSLQTMLYSLHQQQVMQLQLLTQLQQQIMSGVTPTYSQLMLGGLGGLAGLPGLPLPASLPAITAAPVTATTTTSSSSSTPSSQNDSKAKSETPCSTPLPPSNPPASSEATPKNPSTPAPKNPFDFFNSPLLTPSTPPEKPKVSGTTLDRSQYAADDPFFKHKCRFCHKVFSSDSGLQIHIRSHTGERPFKCNICGNRFSTRGNLKVHFQRHKDQYPYVKMNPDPVPEHLDHLDEPTVEQRQAMERQAMDRQVPPMIPPLIPASKRSPEALVIKPTSSDVSKGPVTPSHPKDGMPSLEKEKGVGVTAPASETPPRSSPSMRDTATMEKPAARKDSLHTLTVSATTTTPTPVISMPLLGTAPPPPPPVTMGLPHPLGMLPFPMDGLPPFMQRPSILPNHDEPLEQYMEIQKSETTKLQQLVENIETKLTDPNQCAICHRILSCKSALQMHYRTHTGERPFRCKICGRSFTTKGNLKTHMGVHRSKPPMRMIHQCPVCHKQFTNALVLQQHIRMHTGDLPKDMPVPTPDMMSYLPYPAFPFMPPMGFPGPPRHLLPHQMGASGELDLRKLSSDRSMYDDPENYDDDDDQKDDKPLSEDGSRDDDKVGDEIMDEGVGDDLSDDEEINKEEAVKDEKSSGVSEEHPPSPPEEKERPSTPKNSILPNSMLSSSTPSTPPKLVSTHEDHKSEYYPYMSLAGQDISTPTSSYSTSLMALEERVKAIESPSPLSAYSHVQPLQQMTDILRRPDMHPGVMFNGNGELKDNKVSPTSPATSTSPGVMNNSDNSNASQGESENSFPGLPGTFSAFDSPFRSMGFDMMSPFRSSGKISTTCNICFKTFACRSALEIHYRSHTKERPYRCEVCERCFSTRGNMRQHMLTHKIRDIPSNNNSNSSMRDGETNSQGSGSSSAMMTTSPTPTSNTITSTPPSATASSAAPTPHTHSEIPKTPKAAAPTSGSSSGPAASGSVSNSVSSVSSANSVSSVNSVSNQESPFVRRPNLKHVCLICNKPFSSASALQIHNRTHTGDKPFKCTICGKAFTTKGNLKVHMGTHMWNNSPSRRGRRMSIDTLPPSFGNPDKVPEFFPGFPHPPRPPTDLYPFAPFPPFPNGFPPKMNEISVIQSINGNMGHLPPTSLPSSLAESMAKSHPLLASPAHSSGPTHSHSSPAHAAGPAHSGSSSHTSPLGPAHSGSSSHLSPREEAHIKMEERSKALVKESNNNTMNGGFGELDLSIRKSPPSLSSPPSSLGMSRPSPVSAMSPPGLMSSNMSSPPSLERAESPRGNPSWVWKTTCHICNKVCSSASSLEIHMKAHMTRPEESSPMQLVT